MNIKQRIGMSMFIVALASQGVMAQSNLTVNYNDNQKAKSIQLNQIKSLKFNGDQLFIKQVDGTSKTIALDNVRSITFGSEVTAVEEIKAVNNKKFRGLLITDLSGKVLVNNPAWEGGQVDTSALPAGFYIIKTSTKTFKIKK